MSEAVRTNLVRRRSPDTAVASALSIEGCGRGVRERLIVFAGFLQRSINRSRKGGVGVSGVERSGTRPELFSEVFDSPERSEDYRTRKKTAEPPDPNAFSRSA